MHSVREIARRNTHGEAYPSAKYYHDDNIHNNAGLGAFSHVRFPIEPIRESLSSTPGGALPPAIGAFSFFVRGAKPHQLSTEHQPITHCLVNRLAALAPPRLRRALCIRKRSVALAAAVLILTFCFLFFDFVYDKILEYNARPEFAASAEVWGIEEFDAPTGAPAVLVQHQGAMARLNVTPPQECGALPGMFCQTNIRMSPQLLPSWTLHAINERCTWCADKAHYSKAVRGVDLVPEHAVFATSSTPLGRIGPMLFAMSSITDDVNLKEELPQWSWMRHVYDDFARTWDDPAPEVTPYLAVMGVPSTDQPARVALRTAQRATWMTYQEVARAENDFNGALLPLYLFAAVEPANTVGNKNNRNNSNSTANRAAAAAAEAGNGDAGTAAPISAAPVLTVDPHTYVNASSIAPTVKEFEYATQARAAAMNNNEDSVHYTHRRVNLRDDWREEELAQSPCGPITTRTVNEESAPSDLATLTATIGLSVTPAFVSGAQYICHASAALWKEALTHRNVVWVDMMTDRRPTTDKKLGENKKWGLPVEVGMSQKLILWLEYAYHAFPNVPYIIKGDDDSYLKVPQFLSDLRMVIADGMSLSGDTDVKTYMSVPFRGASVFSGRAGFFVPFGENKHALGGTTNKNNDNTTRNKNHQQEYGNRPAELTLHTSADAMPCIYWGSLRIYKSVRFAAGMMLMVHRNMVQGLFSSSLRRRRVDVMKLATHTYHSRYANAYRRSMFHREDILFGLLLNASMAQSEKFCAQERVFYMREGLARFHDLHKGKVHDVTWSTIVAHRVHPADYYYLHYFFHHEHLFSKEELPRGVTAEANALQHVKDWVMEQKEQLSVDVVGWNSLPAVQWTHAVQTAPPYVVEDEDQVAVYQSRICRLQHFETRIKYGYQANYSF